MVTNTNDSGPGSLRQAIIDANNSPYYESPEIDFNISASYAVSGVFTVRPLSPLPALDHYGITVDGRTQTAYTGATNQFGPEIVLDGSVADSGNGLTILSDGNSVLGLDIVNFPSAGIEISGNGTNVGGRGNRIAGCYIGVDATGAKADGNGYRGVFVWNGGANVIGGTTAADRNVISGARNWEGVGIFGGGANVIEGNYIGTDSTGARALGNEGRGVDIEQSTYNTVGGTEAGSGNVISGNAGLGIGIVGAQSFHNTIQGNYIGVSASGAAAVPNRESGVFIWGGASNNWIGVGGVPGRNVISGNGGDGVVISDTGTQNNLVAGNYIGTDASGTKALGNASHGINIWGSASANIVGGWSPSERNIISANGGDGVIISNAGTLNNLVAGNYVGTDTTGTNAIGNAGRGVDIELAPYNEVVGNVISGNAQGGVDIDGAQADSVYGNYIGTDASGRTALGNGADGITIVGGASYNTIGGSAPAARNLISGNLRNGVDISGAGTQFNHVVGNYIGTDATANAAIPNYWDGVEISSGASQNTIGSVYSADQNVISGNSGNGVQLTNYAVNNLVQGNLIGTNAAGSGPLGNGADGVAMNDASVNSVLDNTISGNALDGIKISGNGALAGATAWWTADGNANDSVGGNNGTLEGGAAFAPGVTGQPGDSAFSFNGATAYVQAPDCNSLDPVNLTVDAWVKFTSLDSPGASLPGLEYLVFKQNTRTTGFEGYTLYKVRSGNTDYLCFAITSAGGQEVALRSTTAVTTGAWYDVTGTYDGTTAKLYVNGVLEASAAAGFPLNYGSEPLFFGSSGETYFNGLLSGELDEPQIYSRALTAAEVQNVYSLSGSAQGGAVIQGNLIGNDATGTTALPNGGSGIDIVGSAGNSIGGTTASARNVISGNAQEGVMIVGTGATGNTVAGNYIGTDAAGMIAVPNYRGVVITGGATQNTIGGSNAGDQNLLSGNWHWGGAGIYVDSLGGANEVVGNLIGVDATGAGKLGNWVGVEVLNSVNSVVRDNVISGNGDGGLALEFSRQTIVAGNRIGTDAAGRQAVPNGTTGTSYTLRNGIGIFTEDDQGDTIGGTSTADRNIIAGNLSDGIVLRSSTQTSIEGNYIGVDASGMRALGNGYGGVINAWGGSLTDGIALLGLSLNNTIGGASPGAKNVISGNAGAGIGLYRRVESKQFGAIVGSESRNTIEGNYIGTDVAGASALGNGGNGITIDGFSITRIYFQGTNGVGPNLIAGNLISGNSGNGVQLTNYAVNNVVQGNLIGTNAAGSSALGNGADGIAMDDASVNSVSGNVISGNSGDGINVAGNGALDGTLDWWTADGNTTDSVGGASGTLQGGATYGPGISGKAFSFNGSSAYVQFGTGVVPTVGSYTVSLFARQNATQDGYVELISQGSPGGPGFYVGHDPSGNIRVGDDWLNTGVPFPTDTRWHLFTVTVDAGANESQLYVDGMLRATLNRTVWPGRGGDATRLGSQFDPYGEYFNGLIDDVAIFSRALSASEVENIYRLRGTALGGAIIAGNYIGTDATGEAAVPNANWGVNITAGASGNFIGVHDNASDAAAERNVISGNGFDGVQIAQQGSDYNVVAGNLIGTDATGAKAIGNYWGVKIVGGAAHNLIGTNADGIADDLERNVISGNRSDGIFLSDAGTQYNTIAGNYIGTDATGTVAVPNALRGVFVVNGASDNTIGGLTDTPGAGAGNVISGNSFQVGLVLQGPGTNGNLAEGNIIGLDKTGQAALANGAGVWTDTSSNTIGGSTPQARNVISGNLGDGVILLGGAATQNVVEGNYIGTDVSGMIAVGNGGRGITLAFGATNNTIGGASGATGNIISGNHAEGVAFDSASGNTLESNYVGTNVDGTAPLPNSLNGIILHAGASNNIIGAPGAGNVISGNDQSGIALFDATTTGNSIEGNLIGTNAAGTEPLGNLFAGVGIVDDASQNTVGGTAAGQGNTIAYNGWSGVLVTGAATGDAIRGNSIYSNQGLGIDLGGDGVTANDKLDADAGPNNLENFPVLRAAEAGSQTRVVGTINSTPGTTLVIDFYASASPDPSGYGEGQRYLGSTVVRTDGGGNAAFIVLLAASTGPGDYISATATDAAGNTSEFSLTLTLDHTAPTSAVNPLPVRATSLSFPVSVSGSDPDATGQVTSGVAAYELYVSVDGGPFAYWTTVPGGSPAAVFTAQSSHLYAFHSVATDNAGNVEAKPVAVEASIYVPDLDPPVSHVDKVDTSSPRFTVNFSATDTGGSGLGTISVFVEIGGAAPQQIATVNAAGSSSYSGSLQYQALEDGASHDYRFYTVAVDRNNNIEAAPAAPSDVELDNVKYSVPATLQVTGFVVEQGAAERSFIRYLEIDFNRNVASELQTIVATLNDGTPADDRMSLTRYDLSGNNPVDATSALAGASIQVIGQSILIDFGPNGIGGNRNSNIGDGYYALAFDLDNNLTNGLEATDHFYRLFGDTNGDRTVNATDLANITAAFGQSGAGLNADINGDDVVNILDRLYASRELGRTLDGSLHLDD